MLVRFADQCLARLSLGSSAAAAASARSFRVAPFSSASALEKEQQEFNRINVNPSASTSGRKPLGDQDTLFHQHNVRTMRSSGSERYARGGYNTGGRGGYSNHRGFSNRNIVGREFTAGSNLRPIDYSREEVAELKKNLYMEHPNVTARSQAEMDAWIAENQVTLKGRDIPRPIFDFAEAPFRKELIEHLVANFSSPTVIQSISWPIAMSGKDIISIAKTGSGKTLGFMLPALMHTLHQSPRRPGEGPSVLVMLPTRELAQQVQQVSRNFCHVLGLKMTCLFGGASKGPQARDLERGVDVVVATPGRLLDFVEGGTTNMKRCSFLVLDEADRMLDMGFEPQIRKIVSQIRLDRQTLMFSATWPKEVRTLAADFQKDAAFLNVGSLELAANHNIKQIVQVVDEYDKQHRLLGLLKEITRETPSKTLIFTETKRKADELTRQLRREGFPALSIHGDKSQSERDWVLAEFKSGKSQILIATDVAARGLDVDDIKYVINFDFPNNSEDYVHRIGRTGRGDKKGTAYSFFTPSDAAKAEDLIKVLDEAKQEVNPELTKLALQGGGGGGRSNYKGGNSRRSFRDDDWGAKRTSRFDGPSYKRGSYSNRW